MKIVVNSLIFITIFGLIVGAEKSDAFAQNNLPQTQGQQIQQKVDANPAASNSISAAGEQNAQTANAGSEPAIEKMPDDSSSRSETIHNNQHSGVEIAVGDFGDSEKSNAQIDEVVDKLKEGKGKLTLSDLNAANAVIARLDILVEIEKKRAELQKIKADSGGDIESSLPSGVVGQNNGHMAPLAPPPIPATMNIPNSMPVGMAPPMNMPVTSGDPEIVRIAGADKKLVAFVKSGDGSEAPIQVGDKLSDGSRVEKISALGVSIARNGESRFLKVKDVGQLFEPIH